MRRYMLRFDNAPDEFVDAACSTDAVAARANERLPHTLTDLTAMALFAGPRYRTPTTPLLDRMYGTGSDAIDEDAPIGGVR